MMFCSKGVSITSMVSKVRMLTISASFTPAGPLRSRTMIAGGITQAAVFRPQHFQLVEGDLAGAGFDFAFEHPGGAQHVADAETPRAMYSACPI